MSLESSSPAAPTSRLVADIGGTWARFGLVEGGDRRPHSVVSQRCDSFANLLEAIRSYLAEQPSSSRPVERATLAVASPVNGDRIQLTNSDWSFSREALQHDLGLRDLGVVNDFAALARAVPLLTAKETRTLNAGGDHPGAPFVVIGPGTGLGVSAAIPHGGELITIETEGGHRDLGATNEEDWEVLRVLRQRFDHVSAERVLSGQGLVNLHHALAEIQGALIDHSLTPADIVARSKSGSPGFRRTTEAFSGWLGSVTGDLVLSYGALGGVYLGGGVLPRMEETFDVDVFLERFAAKGRFRDYLLSAPVHLILDRTATLRGAATWPAS